MRVLTILLTLAAATGPLPAWSDDAAESQIVRDLLEAGQIDDAEEAFQAAIQDSPESPALAAVRPLLYAAHAKAGRWPQAAEHATAAYENALARFADGKERPRIVVETASRAAAALTSAGRPEAARRLLERALALADQQAAEEEETAALIAAVGELRLELVRLLMRTKQTSEAVELFDRELEDSRQRFEADPDDVERAVRLAYALEAGLDVVVRTDREAFAARRTEYLDFIAAQAEQHPENAVLLSADLRARAQAIRDAAQEDPDAAEALLSVFRDRLSDLRNGELVPQGLVDDAQRGLEGLEKGIAASRKRLARIGSPATELDVSAWVNGGPLEEADLTGKVVLLDFWAVWCGPCIATFPHLRAWQEQYESRGLLTIGVTRYYEYGWDSAAKRAKRVKELPPESECGALEEFARFHELRHRFAVVPKESRFHDSYAVSSIPQVVLIDRRGIVRMIRVGGGRQSARELEAMIERLLEE